MNRPPHEHWWFYFHGIIRGKARGESRVVRRCECGRKEMAIIPATAWKTATGDYRRSEHYGGEVKD